MSNLNFSTFSSFQHIHPAERLKYLLARDFKPISISDLFHKHGLDFSDFDEGTAVIAEDGDLEVIIAKEEDDGWQLIAMLWGEVSFQETYTISLTYQESF